MNRIDAFLNTITMYRLVFWGLFVLALLSIIGGFIGAVSYSGVSLLISLVFSIATCHFFNHFFVKVYKAAPNSESAYITALILFFIIDPTALVAVVLGGVLAMVSKYAFAIQRRHICNPAAFGAVILGLWGIGSAIWWVATPILIVPTLILGLLIVRKVRRFLMAGVFLAVVLICALISSVPVVTLFLSGPVLFFACIMLTEPRTASTRLYIWYGVIVGVFFGLSFFAPFSIGPLYMTPELALIIGNIWAYVVSSRQYIRATYLSRTQLTSTTYDLTFAVDQSLEFTPGQYAEWTLPIERTDNRGNRRYFTIASSPTNTHEVHLAILTDPARSSSFKKSILALIPGDPIFVTHVAGSFIMPSNTSEKLVFIAGGIGITPFYSMAQYLKEKGEVRDIVLFYASRTPGDIAYKQWFEEHAAAVGMKVIYVVATTPDGEMWAGKTGFITPELVVAEVPDYVARTYYLSGPPAMVKNYYQMLKKSGITEKNIKTDYFPGF